MSNMEIPVASVLTGHCTVSTTALNQHSDFETCDVMQGRIYIATQLIEWEGERESNEEMLVPFNSSPLPEYAQIVKL